MIEDASTPASRLTTEGFPYAGTGPLWEILEQSLQRADLDAHLALFIIESRFGVARTASVRAHWHDTLCRVLDQPLGPSLNRPQDVAVLGLRLALGREFERSAEFRVAAGRELAREPLPPAACVRDDARLLLGVAAGIAAVDAGELADTMSGLLRAREHTASYWQACIDRYAETLIGESGASRNDALHRIFRFLIMPPSGQSPRNDRDAIVGFWLGTRLLERDWKPGDDDLGALGRFLDQVGYMTRSLLTRADLRADPLDAAMILDALTAAPVMDLSRGSAIETVHRIIDGIPAAASILNERQRGRRPLVIGDEYDFQDVFHAMTIPHVPDLIPEDPASKVAGKSSRLDFTSRKLRLGIELKVVRNASHADDVRKELLIDEGTYQLHPFVDTVVAAVYDPKHYLSPALRPAFEADLTRPVRISGRSVQYRVKVVG